MARQTIAVIGTGDMGSAVGAVLHAAGHRVVTDLSERSAHSRVLAERANLEDVGSLARAVAEADVVLSILPPAAAFGFARRVVAALEATGARPVFADCNAVSPTTLAAIAALFAGSRGGFVDVGIVGPAPRLGTAKPTRFYVAGPARARLLALAAPEIAMIDMGPEAGRASALKMTYAALNKGIDALHTAVLMAAEQLGVRPELMAELAGSQARELERMTARVPYLAATAARYTGEMREIAATFAVAGVTPGFHEGAEWVYARLARTPYATETRATLPAHRSLDEAIATFCAAPAE